MSRTMRFALAAGFVASAGLALGQPYGWIPGSSADNPETGNRIVVIDLGAEEIVGIQDDGFQFTTESGGADPLAPTFSPDGSKVYILVGGDFDANPNGHLYVFDTADTISKLQSEFPPAPNDALQKIVLEVPENEDSPLEPVAMAMTRAGDKLVMTEAGYDRAYVWDINPDGSIDESSETILNTVDDPSPPFIKNDDSRAFFCTQLVMEGSRQDTPPKIKWIDLTQDPPTLVDNNIVIEPPTQGAGTQGITTIPFATCAFEQLAGTTYTAVEPPNADPHNDDVLYAYTGYIGLKGSIQLGSPPLVTTIPFSLSDDFHIYQLDTNTGTLLNSGDPVYDSEVDLPNHDEVIFGPLVSPWVKQENADAWAHAGGSVLYDPQKNAETLKPDNADLLLGFSMMEPNGNRLFIGSLQGFDGNYYLTNNALKLKDGPSDLYIYDTTARTTTLTSVKENSRALTFPLGFVEGTKLVYGTSDGLFLLPVGTDDDAQVAEKSQIGFYTLDTGADNIVDLGLVAGAYAQQPVEETYEGRPFGDFDNSGCTDLNDFLTLLDNWQQPFGPQNEVIGLDDFLNLLDNWQNGC